MFIIWHCNFVRLKLDFWYNRPGREWRAIACARPHTRQNWVRHVVIARLHFNGECGVNKLFYSCLENSWITRNTFFRIADAQDIEINNQPTIKSNTVMQSNKCQHKVIYQRHACNPYVNHVCCLCTCQALPWIPSDRSRSCSAQANCICSSVPSLA